MKAGDRITLRAKTKRVAPSQRAGTIEEVLDPDQPRYLVRWDDGRTTVIAPLPGTVTVQPPGKAKAAAEDSYRPVTPTRIKAKAAPRKRKIRKT